MPFGLEKRSGGADKDKDKANTKEKATAAPANEAKDAPPAYTATEPADGPPGSSVEDLSAAFSSLNIPDVPPALPTPDHCLAHLKLLNSFHALKEDIGYTDGLFGLWDERCEVLEGKERDEALARTREKRWALYIARAVERFQSWWLKYLCSLEDCKRLQAKEMTSTSLEYAIFTAKGRPRTWTTTMLPPIGKDHSRGETWLVTDVRRCSHGLACTYA